MILTVEEILEANDLPEETLSIPEWGGEVVVRGLSRGEAWAAREEGRRDGDFDMLAFELNVFLHGVVNPKFSKKHFGQLKCKSQAAMERVTNKILAMSNAGSLGEVTQEVVDEAEKSFRDEQA